MLARASILLSNMPDARNVLDTARIMDQLGYERVWLAETNALEVGAAAGAIAATTDLEIGSAIVPVYTRSPAVLAMLATTVSRLGQGRVMHLGIGAGGQVAVERWHGTAHHRPLGTVEDTITILRQALAGGRTEHAGAQRSSTGFRLMDGPPSAVKVHLGGMGPGMRKLAARSADGLIVTWLSSAIVAELRTELDANTDAAERPAGAVDLIARQYVCVCDDPQAARESVRRELVEYLISPPYGNYFTEFGYGAQVAAARAGYEARDRERAVAAVSDALLDEMLVCGRKAADIADRLYACFDAGADQVMIQPVPLERAGDPERTVRAVAEALR